MRIDVRGATLHCINQIQIYENHSGKPDILCGGFGDAGNVSIKEGFATAAKLRVNPAVTIPPGQNTPGFIYNSESGLFASGNPDSGLSTSPLTLESIEEFKLQNNSFSSEFGSNGETTVSFVTESDTNQFHGSGYLFDRRPQPQTATREGPGRFRKAAECRLVLPEPASLPRHPNISAQKLIREAVEME